MQTIVDLVRRFPFIVFIVVIAAVGIIFRDQLTGAAADLRVGDCFELPLQAVDVRDVQHRPCGDAHDAEVFHVFNIASETAGGPRAFPSDAQLVTLISPECTPAFNSYTGLNFEAAVDYDWGAFTPTQAGWTDGDRGVTCYTVRVDGTKMSGTLRAAP